MITLAIADAAGAPLDEWADFVDVDGQPGLEYTLSVGGIGALIVRRLDTGRGKLIPLDGRVGAWRSFAQRAPVLDCDALFLARDYTWGPHWQGVTCYHVNELLERRIIAYDAGSAYTGKTDTADDLIKAYASQNMGAGVVVADRDGGSTYAAQTDISAYVTIQADLSLAPSLTDASTRRRLDRIVAELSQAAATQGAYLVAEIVPSGAQGRSLELRTYVNQRGIDRRAGTAQELIFSEDRGNIENVTVRELHREEATVVIAGGAGVESARAIEVAMDATRLAASPLNRRELFIEHSDITTSTVLQAKAQAALRANAPTITIEGDLIPTPSATRGIHYNLGDLVTVEHRAGSFDVRLETLSVRVSQGKVRDTMRFRGVL
jgi:hypothetical protein